MSSQYPTLTSRPRIPHIEVKDGCPKCKASLEFPVPSPKPAPGASLRIRCHNCQSIFTHAFPSANGVGVRNGRSDSTAKSQSQPDKRGGRKIGTQERPLEMEYYDILGVPANATTEEIKKAYRNLPPVIHHSRHSRAHTLQDVSRSNITRTRTGTIQMQKTASSRSRSLIRPSPTKTSDENTTSLVQRRARPKAASSTQKKSLAPYSVASGSCPSSATSASVRI